MNNYTAHEIANIFPMMSDDEFVALKADILANGLLEPIWTYEGRILDGRNRHQACQEVDVDITAREYVGNDPVGFVVSLNLKRRHLSSSQLAVSAVEILPWYEVEAKKRQGQRNDLKLNIHQKIDESENTPKSTQALEHAAKACGTNRQYVADAKKLKEENQVLFDKVKHGALTLPAAKIISNFPEEEQQEVLAEIAAGGKSSEVISKKQGTIRRSERIENLAEISKGNEELEISKTYPVIYCDPPWRYDYSISDSRQIENQYPTMDLSEICALPVNDLSTQDAILFMWATSPKFADAIDVIKAWGFTYKTCAVWDKQKLGMGYYFRQQHELLLVATKGEIPTPPVAARVSSIISIARGEHSEKPVYFHELIEKMYSGLPKLELFCRKPRQGWSVWGNQCC